MKKTDSIILLVAIGFIGIAVSAIMTNVHNNTPAVEPDLTLPTVTVYKSASCGCCKKWVKHMQDSGFRVEAHNVDNMQSYKEQAKLGAGMGSCHTAFVDDYAIEGHVPAWDVKRLLLEKPDISGLTVPRMPIGTPGMEVPGKPADPYQVLSYKDGKQVSVFSNYPKSHKGTEQ